MISSIWTLHGSLILLLMVWAITSGFSIANVVMMTRDRRRDKWRRQQVEEALATVDEALAKMQRIAFDTSQAVAVQMAFGIKEVSKSIMDRLMQSEKAIEAFGAIVILSQVNYEYQLDQEEQLNQLAAALSVVFRRYLEMDPSG